MELDLDKPNEFYAFADAVAQRVFALIQEKAIGKTTVSKRKVMKDLQISFCLINKLIEKGDLKVDANNKIYVSSLEIYKRRGIAA